MPFVHVIPSISKGWLATMKVCAVKNRSNNLCGGPATNQTHHKSRKWQPRYQKVSSVGRRIRTCRFSSRNIRARISSRILKQNGLRRCAGRARAHRACPAARTPHPSVPQHVTLSTAAGRAPASRRCHSAASTFLDSVQFRLVLCIS